MGPAWQDHGLLFTCEDGSPVHPDTFFQFFERHVKAAKLPTIRLHDLRHTFATNALAAGISLYELARFMGTSVRMIDQTYGHPAQRPPRGRSWTPSPTARSDV